MATLRLLDHRRGHDADGVQVAASAKICCRRCNNSSGRNPTRSCAGSSAGGSGNRRRRHERIMSNGGSRRRIANATGGPAATTWTHAPDSRCRATSSGRDSRTVRAGTEWTALRLRRERVAQGRARRQVRAQIKKPSHQVRPSRDVVRAIPWADGRPAIAHAAIAHSPIGHLATVLAAIGRFSNRPPGDRPRAIGRSAIGHRGSTARRSAVQQSTTGRSIAGRSAVQQSATGRSTPGRSAVQQSADRAIDRGAIGRSAIDRRAIDRGAIGRSAIDRPAGPKAAVRHSNPNGLRARPLAGRLTSAAGQKADASLVDREARDLPHRPLQAEEGVGSGLEASFALEIQDDLEAGTRDRARSSRSRSHSKSWIRAIIR